MHTGEKPYHCVECDKNFRTSTHLALHKRIHSNDKPYKCEHCAKKFKQSSQLQQHKLLHLDRFLHKCDICEVRFPRASSLKSHKTTHTEEKPFKCIHCKMSYKFRSCLLRHRKSLKCTCTSSPQSNTEAVEGSLEHDQKGNLQGKKPRKDLQQCWICLKSFARSANLLKHIDRHCQITCGDPESDERDS